MTRWTTFHVGGVPFAVSSEPLPEAPSLTEAERGVLALLLEGLSNAEIAKRRKTSVRTVANQVASLFKKHGVSSRSELAAKIAR